MSTEILGDTPVGVEPLIDPAASAESTGAVRGHLQRLERTLPLLADISLADVLILRRRADAGGFDIVAHRRPMNARTVYTDDQLGRVLPDFDRPLLAEAWKTGEIVDGGIWLRDQQRWIRTLAVPVRFEGEIVAMLSREFSPKIEEIPGDLETNSFMVLRRLAAMIAEGTYPFRVETRGHDHPPRVGDGLIVLDHTGVIAYASPNANTVLRTLGVNTLPSSRRFSDLGLDGRVVATAFAQRLARSGEVERNGRAMSLRCIPLLEAGAVAGALLLVRDISELRDRDRLLMTKDATIAEIHHRVKNNLQTISSLLHLQSRRTESPEAQEAINESVRRIRAIAVVHEILSHRTTDEVPFSHIVQSLVQIVRDVLTSPSRPIHFTVDADESVLSSETTTTLAVVMSELLQNCIDHAFDGLPSEAWDHGDDEPTVEVTIRSLDDVLQVAVADNGSGLPEGFDITASTGLGLTIVRTLVESELRGEFQQRRIDGRNVFAIAVPLLQTDHRTD